MRGFNIHFMTISFQIFLENKPISRLCMPFQTRTLQIGKQIQIDKVPTIMTFFKLNIHYFCLQKNACIPLFTDAHLLLFDCG